MQRRQLIKAMWFQLRRYQHLRCSKWLPNAYKTSKTTKQGYPSWSLS